MWFKNLKAYRLSPEFNATDLNERLEKFQHQPVSSQDSQNSG